MNEAQQQVLQEMRDRTQRMIKHIQDDIVEYHEANIAYAQRRADEATDPQRREEHQDEADRLRAQPYPWEDPTYYRLR